MADLSSTKIILIAFSVCLYSCSPSGLDRDEVQAQVKAALLRYHADIKKEGLIAEFRYLEQSPDFFWVPPGYRQAISYDSVAAVLRAAMHQQARISNTFETLQVLALDSDLAAYTGRLLSLVTGSDRKTDTLRLIESGLMRKREGTWKLLWGQTSVLK